MTRLTILRRAAAALGLSAGLSGPECSPAPASAEAVAKAPAAARRRARRASAGDVAAGLARDMIDQGLAGYPLLPCDVDAAAAAWCAARELDVPAATIVREALAATPGVTRERIRLKTADPAHRALAARLRRLGRSDARATVFFIAGLRLLQTNPSQDSPPAPKHKAARRELAVHMIAPRQCESGAGAATGAVAASGRAA